MTSLVPLSLDMLPDIHRLVVEGLDAAASLTDVRRVFFDHQWTHEGVSGYGLADRGRLVGVLGLIFSQRSLGGQTVPFCNLHSWYVQSAYRGKSLLMMKPVISRRDVVITDFTPGPQAARITQRLGFELIDHMACVLRPIDEPTPTNADIIEVTAVNEHELAAESPLEWRLYRDHQPFGCGCALVRDESGCGAIVYSRVQKGALAHCQVNYLGAPPLLVRHHAALRAHLMHCTGERRVVIESRLLQGHDVPGGRLVRSVSKFARLSGPIPAPIDTLYSEVVLLRHPTLLTTRQRLREYADRYVPRRVMRLLGRG